MSFDYWDINTGEGLSDYQLHRRFDDMLDETMDEVSIGTLTYPASVTLRSVDPIAYRVWYSDWLDAELNESITDEAPSSEDDED